MMRFGFLVSGMLAANLGTQSMAAHQVGLNIMHLSFALGDGLQVAAVIAGDSGEEPSTRQIARLCDLVNGLAVKALFVEPQYPTRTADVIARETGASVYTLDPVVSGEGSMDSYEISMRENARVLAEALSK